MIKEARLYKENNVFFKRLKVLCEGECFLEQVGSSKKSPYFPAIAVYELLDTAVPYLIRSLDNGVCELDQHLRHQGVSALLEALKKVKVFPKLNEIRHSDDEFFECLEFNHYVHQVVCNSEVKSFPNSQDAVTQEIGGPNSLEENHAKTFLKKYIEWRGARLSKGLLDSQFGSNEDFLENSAVLTEVINPEIDSILAQVGFIYVAAFKVSVCSDSGDDCNLHDFEQLLYYFGQRAEVKYVMAVNYIDSTIGQNYYVVCFLQRQFSIPNESQIAYELRRDVQRKIDDSSLVGLQIDVQCLNDKFRKLQPSLSSDMLFILKSGNDASLNVCNQVVGFTEHLLKFGQLTDIKSAIKKTKQNSYDPDKPIDIHKVIRAIKGLKNSEKNRALQKQKVIWQKCNELEFHQSLWHLLNNAKRMKLIWDQKHLTENAKDYFVQISLIISEQLATWDLSRFTRLAIKIELFMLSLMEANTLGFYAEFSGYRVSRRLDNMCFEQVTTRHLFQFADLCKEIGFLTEFTVQMEGKIVSKAQGHFLSVFRNQMRESNSSALLYRFLYSDLDLERNREQIEKLLGAYQFKGALFYQPKKNIKTHQPIFTVNFESKDNVGQNVMVPDVRGNSTLSIGCKDSTNSLIIDDAPPKRSINTQQIINNEGADQTLHLLHMQRHKTRLKKVKEMLNFSMQQDVVIIRCLFSVQSKTKLTQLDISKLFSNMLQANKKSLPFSFITGYLGYWEGIERSESNKILGFAANVIFIFKAQVLIQCPNLIDALSKAWQKSCDTYCLEKTSVSSIDGVVKKLRLMHSVPELNHEQLILETTHKKLAKIFIHRVAPIAVYQDVLDDEIYQKVPKWLIKKNVKQSPSKTAKLKKAKT